MLPRFAPALLACAWLAFGSHVQAHPVTQGAMEVLLHASGVEVHVRASNEEAFVAEMLGAQSSQSPGHGAYLLAHLKVQADGQLLTGRLVAMKAPADLRPNTLGECDFEYSWPAGAKPPREVQIGQDVLNEIDYAPGNRWEASYVVTVRQDSGAARTGLLLTSREPLIIPCDWQSPPRAAAPARIDQGQLFAAYLKHGLWHILTGYDHLLFMTALVLAVTSLVDLIKVVTAFTLAHTITLTLSVLDVVRLSERIVEPLIALSILVVALQNIFWPKQTRGWARLAVAFGFGLFHGLGFAGGLLEAMAGLPGLAVATAIVAFSIGVELGHQAVVLPVFGGLALAQSALPGDAARRTLRRDALRFGSLAVCLCGAFYLVAALRA